jgi:hypothetical protein
MTRPATDATQDVTHRDVVATGPTRPCLGVAGDRGELAG